MAKWIYLPDGYDHMQDAMNTKPLALTSSEVYWYMHMPNIWHNHNLKYTYIFISFYSRPQYMTITYMYISVVTCSVWDKTEYVELLYAVCLLHLATKVDLIKRRCFATAWVTILGWMLFNWGKKVEILLYFTCISNKNNYNRSWDFLSITGAGYLPHYS